MSTTRFIEAFVARLQPVRDSDLIVTLLSPDRGRVDAWVRSGRKSSRRFGGRLEPFVFGRAGLRPGRGTLANFVTLERQGVLVGSTPTYRALCLASYVVELAMNALQPECTDPRVYRWALNAIGVIALDDSATVGACKLSIDVGFLAATGHLAEVQRCGQCRAGLSDGACWPAGSDTLLCPNCAPRDTDRIHADLIVDMVGLCASVVDGTPPLVLADAGQGSLGRRIARRMEESLPHPMRTEQALRAIV